MKRNAIFVILALILTSCATRRAAVTVPSVSPTKPPLTMLHTVGNRIVDIYDKEISLHGCNIGSWLLIEPWMLMLDDQKGIESEKDLWDVLGQRFGKKKKLELISTFRNNFFTQNDVVRIAQLDMNCLRVPIWWRAVSDPNYGGSFEYLDHCIQWCSENGIYVIIDLHGAPGGQSVESRIIGERADALLWKKERYKKETVNWWREVAKRYRDEPAVAGYDLINEAYSAEMDDLIDLYDEIYDAIRKIDPKHMLIVEDGLLGFHRMPRPVDQGWTNVVYSFHYYPKDSTQGLTAANTDFLRLNRMALYFDVPVYIGEFNSMQIERGGASSFLRFIEAFDYFNWDWSFWSYKKIENNYDYNWGLYGYYRDPPKIDVYTDTFEEIRDAFIRMRTENSEVNPLLQTLLKKGVRRNFGGMRKHIYNLYLDTAYILPANDRQARIEWGRTFPNIGYWGPGDRVAWTVYSPLTGPYEFGINYANGSSENKVRIWLDGVQVVDIPLIDTGGWEKYRAQVLTSLLLEEGRHTIEIGQGDLNNSFINLRGAWLHPTAVPPSPASEQTVRLGPVNMDPPEAGTPIRVEWWHNPPNIGYWRSGEDVSWSFELSVGGTYRLSAAYATPYDGTRLYVTLHNDIVVEKKLDSTGEWHKYKRVDLGELTLGPGQYTFTVIWETPHQDGTGNFRELLLERAD